MDDFARRAFGWAALAPIAMVLACGSQKLGAQGGTCLQATDCKEGLVCVPQTNGPNICSSDLSTIQLTEDATAPAADAAAKRDAAPDAPATSEAGSPEDAGPTQDVTTSPPNDATAPDGSSTTPMDAASPPDDATTE